MALKRQQAAEDAIALKMAKVATGQKLNRLPPGKIFGMSVTEPKSIINDNKETDSGQREEEEGAEDSRQDFTQINQRQDSPVCKKKEIFITEKKQTISTTQTINHLACFNNKNLLTCLILLYRRSTRTDPSTRA